MAKITMDLIKELREKTQVGMMDCKKALIEAEGDMEKAVEILRKKGAAVAAKRASNETVNGIIEAAIAPDFKAGSLVKISCETDFSANTKDMKDFADELSQHILKTSEKSIKDVGEVLLEQKLTNDPSIKIYDRLHDIIAKIAENIKVEEFAHFKVENNGMVNAYIHPGANIGVLVELETDKPVEGENLEELKKLSKDICMQVVVTNPICIKPEQIDSQLLEKEKEIIKDQLKSSGKPENMIEKIMIGKLNKYYQEVCLLHQAFIKDDKLSIKDQIAQVEKKTGLKIDIKQFQMLAVGK